MQVTMARGSRFAVAVIALTTGACADQGPTAPAALVPEAPSQARLAAVATVLVSPPTQTLTLGQERVLTAFAMSASGSFLWGQTATWKSSNPAVVSVSSAGAATAVGGGTATVTATIAGVSGTSVVTVDAPLPAIGIKISGASTLSVGENAALFATPVDKAGDPAIGSFDISWSSSDPTVAKVSATGVVEALQAGSATITAATEGVKGTTSVTVTNNEEAVKVSRSGIAKVVLTPSYQQMEQGQVRSMGVILLDKNGNTIPLRRREVMWKSTNPGVAEVIGPNTILGASPGFAKVTATVEGIVGTAEFAITRAY